MKTVVIGAGGHARVILDILKHDPNIEVVGVIDRVKHSGEKIEGIPVLGDFSMLPQLIKERNIKAAIVGVGDNQVRAKYFNQLCKLELELINAIHPSVSIADNVVLGTDVVIAREAIVCVDAKIGNNVIINTGSIIEHQDVIEDHVHIGPGVNLAGRVTVKKGSFIGIGSTVIQQVVVGENTIIGAGSIVTENIPDNVVAVGTPARVIKKSTPKEQFDLHQVFDIPR